MPDAGRDPDDRIGVRGSALPRAAGIEEGREPEPGAEDRRGEPELDVPDGERIAAGRRDGHAVLRVDSPSGNAAAVFGGDDIHHGTQLVPIEAADVVRTTGVEPLLGRNEGAALGADVHLG